MTCCPLEFGRVNDGAGDPSERCEEEAALDSRGRKRADVVMVPVAIDVAWLMKALLLLMLIFG